MSIIAKWLDGGSVTPAPRPTVQAEGKWLDGAPRLVVDYTEAAGGANLPAIMAYYRRMRAA